MSAKDLVLKPIAAREANAVVRDLHYSGKVAPNSQLHIGAFYKGDLEGAMQFGPSIDKRKTKRLVTGTEWNGFIELNRLAFSDRLPRNSESRALAIAMRILRRHAPHLKWVISFADATQCGDGTIYRAANFVLTGIKRNNQMLRMPDGTIMAKKSLDHPNHRAPDGRFGSAYAIEQGATPLPGYQLRYIYFLDPTWRSRLTVDEIPYNDIPPEVRMYRGQPASEEGL